MVVEKDRVDTEEGDEDMDAERLHFLLLLLLLFRFIDPKLSRPLNKLG